VSPSRQTVKGGERPGSAHRSASAPRPYELRAYALVADGRRGALIDPDGNVAWMCFPRWESPAVFAGIWGTGGLYRVRPEGRAVWGGSYEYGSLIWVSRWETETGLVESRDALVFPGGDDRAVLLRRLRATGDAQEVVAELQLAGNYGREAIDHWEREGGLWQARSATFTAWWSPGGPAREVRVAGGHRTLRRRIVVEPGRPVDLVLELATRAAAGAGPSPAVADHSFDEVEQVWQQTEHAWASTVPSSVPAVAERDVRHSCAVLRGLTAPSGGTVAAATASLPEHAREGRDFDYRYVWIRDLCFIGQAGAKLGGGCDPLLDDAVRFVGDRLREDGAAMLPAYTVEGDPVPDQQRLDLPGYPGGHDMIGNHVRQQFQLDGLGEALLLFAAAARADRLDADGWRAASAALAGVEKRWREPDAGIWELDNRRWAHSRLVCVAGIRALCAAGAPRDWSSRFLALADGVLADTARHCLHPTGRWQRAPDDERVDAALLLASLRGALPADDPRSVATRLAVSGELSRDGYVFRYHHGHAELGDVEGAFLICNFWLAMSCVAGGEPVAAARWFERARASCGPPGLLAEEFDVEQRQLAGNLPQAFVHASLIEAAVAQETIEEQHR
jgi:GH15 family glucan-1,4-alpha-glucosidase